MKVKSRDIHAASVQLFHSSERFSRGHDLQNAAEIIIKSVYYYITV